MKKLKCKNKNQKLKSNVTEMKENSYIQQIILEINKINKKK